MRRTNVLLLAISFCVAVFGIGRGREKGKFQLDSQKAPSTVASINKKNGQIIRGEIKGEIVQGTEEQTVKEGDRVSYVQTHSLVNGADIRTIDSAGIKLAEGSEVRTITLISYSPPGSARKWSDVNERLTVMDQFLSLGVPGTQEKDQFKIIVFKGAYKEPEPESPKAKTKLLGEFKGGKIASAIEVKLPRAS
jgi:hypothetical protein